MNNGYNPSDPYNETLKRWDANIHSRAYPDALPGNEKVELYQCRPGNVNPNESSINSYYSFSIYDDTTDEWITILRSRSAPNVTNRFKEIDVTVHERTIRKAAGQTVAGTIYTPHLLRGLIRVERVDVDILVSELGWVCSNEDAKALLKRALNLTQEGKTRVELEFLRLVKDHTPVQITRIKMLAAIVRKDGKNEVAQLAQLWRDAERTHKAEVAHVGYRSCSRKEGSYYSFSMRDESTKNWITILRSRSAPNAECRFREIDFTTCNRSIRKAAGDTVGGTIYTSHLLKGVMRVERVDVDILVSELGWVCSNEDAKVLLKRAGLTNEVTKADVSAAANGHLRPERVTLGGRRPNEADVLSAAANNNMRPAAVVDTVAWQQVIMVFTVLR